MQIKAKLSAMKLNHTTHTKLLFIKSCVWIYFNYTKFCGCLLKLTRCFEVNFYHPTCRTIKVKLSIIRHSLWKKVETIFDCTICNRQFKSQTGAKLHMKVKHGSKGKSCTTCSLLCHSKAELDRHIKTHGNKKISLPTLRQGFRRDLDHA